MVSILRHLTALDARLAIDLMQDVAAGSNDTTGFVQKLLDRLPALVPSELTTLSLCDLRAGRRGVVRRAGEELSDEDCAAFDRHFRTHPLVRFHSTRPAPAQRISDLMSTRKFRDTALYSDYYRRIGISHVLALPLRADETQLISVVFNRAGADFRDRERAVLEALREPLGTIYRNILSREELERRQSVEALSEDVLDALAVGVIVLAANGSVLRMNRAAQTMIAAKDGLRLHGQRLCCNDAAASAALIDAIRATLAPAAEPQCLGVQRHGRRPLALPFVPLRSGAREAAALFIIDPERAPSPALDAFAGLYGLTPAETRLLGEVMTGQGLGHTARRLGISLNTARTHLARILAKTGTARQVELVRLVSDSTPSLAGGRDKMH
jgi:DNA-binding CsgD family transcriptional regulator